MINRLCSCPIQTSTYETLVRRRGSELALSSSSSSSITSGVPLAHVNIVLAFSAYCKILCPAKPKKLRDLVKVNNHYPLNTRSRCTTALADHRQLLLTSRCAHLPLSRLRQERLGITIQHGEHSSVRASCSLNSVAAPYGGLPVRSGFTLTAMHHAG